ncbi:MAG: nucleoside triphosphate pyrophosphohydrolase [Hyphomicrobiales bacterium]|nr:nucleoside triphosphate pyrophosphohydrolase [Hyphomicrobiales bacterium]
MKPGRNIERLIKIMAALRDPETGCAWDKEQTFATIAPYTIEEAHEVADAAARDDMGDLCDELGDLLLQVVFHARMAEEVGAFSFPDVVEAITTKMIRRHPHVFGDEDARASGAAKGMWERIKAEEKRERALRRGGDEERPSGVLDDVGNGLPPLLRAVKLQEKASTVGFDWDDPLTVLAKLREEIREVEDELEAGAGPDRVADEIGDLLFAVANLARHLAIDPAQALTGANAKFTRRFAAIEKELRAQGRKPIEVDLAEMETLWQASKVAENG